MKTKTSWKKGDPSPNPNGRNKDFLKGLSPRELKSALSKLKKNLPKAIDIIIELMEKEEGVSQAKVAKELITLYVTLDNHNLKRANDLDNLINKLSKREIDDEDTETSKSLQEEDEDSRGAVFSLVRESKE